MLDKNILKEMGWRAVFVLCLSQGFAYGADAGADVSTKETGHWMKVNDVPVHFEILTRDASSAQTSDSTVTAVSSSGNKAMSNATTKQPAAEWKVAMHVPLSNDVLVTSDPKAHPYAADWRHWHKIKLVEYVWVREPVVKP